MCSDVLTRSLSAQLAATRLQKVMVTFLLRRKKDTQLDGKPLIDLPPKEVVMKRLEFTEEEREIYSMVSCQCISCQLAVFEHQ